MGARIAAAALAAGFATAVLMGCGIDTQEAGKSDTQVASTSTSPTSTTGVNTTAAKNLPKRPAGTVAVEGPLQGSLTPLAIQRVSGVQVNFANVGENQGFEDLCRGRIDVLDASRQPSRAELRLCRRNGVELTDQPIQVASDAVIVATRNEADVGGDCLRLSTVNDIYRAGSPLTNWSQVGFFSIPMRVTGREASAASFQFFAQTVLGVPANASLADLRSDYIPHTTDDGVRREVTSEARVARVLRTYRPRLRDLELRRSIALQDHVTRTINRARDRVLRQIARENKSRADRLIVLTATQKVLIERSNLRHINAATRAAQARALANFTFPRLTFLKARVRQLLRRARVSGTIGFFRFSYYELFENLLRPMEIWDPATAAAVLRKAGVNVTTSGPTTTTTPTTTTRTTTVPTATTTTGTNTTSTTATTTTAAAPSDESTVNINTTPWCVFPSQATITNGSYPLSRRLLLYVSKLNIKREEVKTFLRSYLANAQALATRNRYVPVPQQLLEDNLATVNGTTTTQTTTTGTGTTTTTTQTTATTPNAQTVPGVASGGTTTTP